MEKIYPNLGNLIAARGPLLFNSTMSCPVETAVFQALQKSNEYFPSIGKYVDTPAGKIGIYQHTPDNTSTNNPATVTKSYIHKDHLGSVIATSDSAANLTFMSYDAWGNRRDADDWSPLSQSEIGSLQSTMSTDRGFTGHEMLDHLQLVHMNGRIYDQTLGRFLSPDPIIQEPNNLQSFNRYSYVWNNPLSYSDPSGFVTEGLDTELRAADGSDNYENYAEPVSSGALVGIGSSEGSSGLGLADGSSGQDSGQTYTPDPGEYTPDDYGNVEVSDYVPLSEALEFLQSVYGAEEGLRIFFERHWKDIQEGGLDTGAESSKSKWNEDDKDAAAVAKDMYRKDGEKSELPEYIKKLTAEQLEKMGLDIGDFEKRNGMAAGLYYNSRTKQYMLGFRGTETDPVDKGDVVADVGQAVGLKTEQYSDAMKLAREVNRKIKGNLVITGHSLGGGLASAASRVTGADAITFNAAGLHPFTVMREHGFGQSSNIRAHRIRGDILTSGQNYALGAVSSFLPDAAGKQISHSARNFFDDPLERHSIDQFIGRDDW